MRRRLANGVVAIVLVNACALAQSPARTTGTVHGTVSLVDDHGIRSVIPLDANAYSIVRIEGEPARNPSFWVRSVHFVHTYQKVGPFWFASSTYATSKIRIFGEAELTIENSAYTLIPQKDRTAKIERQVGLLPRSGVTSLSQRC